MFIRERDETRQWMTTTEATSYLGVSSKTMTRLIREGIIRTEEHPLDRRKNSCGWLTSFVLRKLLNASQRSALLKMGRVYEKNYHHCHC